MDNEFNPLGLTYTRTQHMHGLTKTGTEEFSRSQFQNRAPWITVLTVEDAANMIKYWNNQNPGVFEYKLNGVE